MPYSLKTIYALAAILLLFFAGCDSNSGSDVAMDLSLPWETATPAASNIDASLIAEAEIKAADIPRVVSLLTVHKGKIVQEAYFHGATASTLLDVRSVTKSVVSTLVGAMLQANLISSLDETVGNHITEKVATLTDDNKDISIRHLLTMSAGFAWDETTSTSYGDWIRSGDHVSYVLNLPMNNAPGSAFTYNSGAVHLLGVLLEEATPQTLEALADSLIFQPLGITSLRWEELSQGYVNAGAGIDLNTRDLARLGQLYLQNGRSGDRQILAPDWVSDATSPRFDINVSNGPLTNVAYGYLWWLAQDQPEPAYFAWGFGGQYIYVVPKLELVVVATSSWQGVSQEEGGALAVEAAVMEIIVNNLVAAFR